MSVQLQAMQLMQCFSAQHAQRDCFGLAEQPDYQLLNGSAPPNPFRIVLGLVKTPLVHCLHLNQMYFLYSGFAAIHVSCPWHMCTEPAVIWGAAAGSEFQVQPQVEPATPVDTKSMLVQEGDPPMGRPVILSKEATLLAQPPSAAWGSAASAGFAPYMQSSAAPGSSVQAGGVTGVTSHVPVETPTQVVQVCFNITGMCMLLLSGMVSVTQPVLAILERAEQLWGQTVK